MNPFSDLIPNKKANYGAFSDLIPGAVKPVVKTPLPEPTYAQNVGAQYTKAGQDIISGIQTGAEQIQKGNTLQGVIGGLRAGLRTAGGVAQAAFAPITEIPVVKNVMGRIAQKAMENKGVQDLAIKLTNLAERYPNQAKDIQNIIDITTLGAGGAAEKPLVAEGKAIGVDIAAGTKALLTPSEEAIQNKVVSLFQKSIKPTAKKTLAQGERYQNDVLDALKTIKNNADNLNIEDATGELISGRTPQTINELAQGIDQTKKIVFNQYDALAKKQELLVR